MCPITLAPLVFLIVFGMVLFAAGATKSVQPGGFSFPGKDRSVVVGSQLVYYRYRRESRRSDSLRIWIKCPSPAEFKINTENPFDRWAKAAGLSEEIQTGDAEFDGRFYLETEDAGFLRALLSFKEKRAAVKQLFLFGFREIGLKKGRLEIEMRPFSRGKPDIPALVGQVVPFLKELSSGLPAVAPAPDLYGTQRDWKSVRNGFFSVAASVLVSGIAFLVWSTFYRVFDPGRIFQYSLRFSGLFLIFFAYQAFRMLKGHSASHRVLGLVFLMALPGSLLLGYGAAAVLNCYGDASPAERHVTRITGKYTTRHKNTTSYHLRLASWRPGRTEEKLRVPREVYMSAVPLTASAELQTRRGRLGFDWLAGYRLKQE